MVANSLDTNAYFIIEIFKKYVDPLSIKVETEWESFRGKMKAAGFFSDREIMHLGTYRADWCKNDDNDDLPVQLT